MPSSPSMTYISHSGRARSSGRACSRAAWMQNWRQSPGFGSAMWRTWILEVELAVLDPVRVIEVERHPHELPPERVREVHPVLQVLEDPLERDLALGAVDGS